MPPVTPLVRPGRFFADREFNAFRLLVVLSVVVLSLPLGVSAAGWVLQDRIDGTVMVDNPNRPSTAFCEGAPASMDVGCDAPAEVERNIDTVLETAIGRLMGPAFLGGLLALLLVGGLLHAGAWAFDPEHGIGTTFAVALWGLLPSVVSLGAGILLLWVTLDPLTVTPDTEPALALERLRGQLRPVERWGPVLTAATTAWGAAIWRAGLDAKQGIPARTATVIAAVVGLVFWGASVV